MRQTVYLHLRKREPYGFVVVKMAKSRLAATRDGDVVMPIEIELPNDFFRRSAITVHVEPLKGEQQ